MIEFIRIENTPVSSNSYLIFDKNISDDCIIIDPGSIDGYTYVTKLESLNLNLKYIILTHEHFDHCWGCNDLINEYRPQLITSSDSCNLIKDPRKNLSIHYNQTPFVVNYECISIESIDYSLNWNDYILNFNYARGHTEAGVFIFLDKFIFTGDTLIPNIKTITTLPTGSAKSLYNSIYFLSRKIGQNYTVLPGHGLPFLLDSYDLSKALPRTMSEKFKKLV